MIKNDYVISAIVALLTGIFAIPTLLNLGIAHSSLFIFLPLFLVILSPIGIYIGKRLASRWPFFDQFSKFLAVGFLNTVIDFGVLNLISHASGVAGGFAVGGVNIPGFTLAVINSYFWNEYWVFQNKNKKSSFENFGKFLAVTLTGLVLNSGVIIFITTSVTPFFGLSSQLWLNLAKVAATSVSLVWNFTGYKFIVFKD